MVFSRIDDLFDVLVAALRGNEHRIGRCDNDQVLHAECCDELALPSHVAAAATVRESVADHDIAGIVLCADVPQGGPRPDVRPSEIHRHDNRLLGTFHHGIVERDRACPLEGFRVEPEEVEICLRLATASSQAFKRSGSKRAISS